ncbi:hypothetical protein L1987_62216 [Smallanthus sonchifolius]|uniref:Uncharacterized protein n=1 Tax=Smallanthus sonchifolius TaxID=185202 RepID=A0ACB9C9S9_9ASTR|nr:hypothetical protein L1987_62216 [Smallanthus sonchifolius]
MRFYSDFKVGRSGKNGDEEILDEGQKLAEMQQGMTNLGQSGGISEDESDIIYQSITWNVLRLSITCLICIVNTSNIKNIIPKLFSLDLIRGRGLFCRACTESQMETPGSADVHAALVAVVNAKLPKVGALLLRRVILQIQIAYKTKDKHQLLAAAKFLAHLINQRVVHERTALVLLKVLLENPTNDGVEVAVGFVTECGSILQDLSPKGLDGIFECFCGILHEGKIDKRVRLLMEGLFVLRKAEFQGHPTVRPELDLVEFEDQSTHETSLLDKMNLDVDLGCCKLVANFLKKEKWYEDLKNLMSKSIMRGYVHLNK